MAKRVQLLIQVLRFQSKHLQTLQTYHPEFNKTCWIIRDLTRRVKKSQRPKYKVEQLEFLKKFEATFSRAGKKRVKREEVEAISHANARKIILERYKRVIKLKVKQL